MRGLRVSILYAGISLLTSAVAVQREPCPRSNEVVRVGDSTQCDVFYECYSNGTVTRRVCDDGLRFGLDTRICQLTGVNCGDRKELQIPKSTNPNCPRKNGYFPHSQQCHMFISCIQDESTTYHCPPGKVFSTDKLKCIPEELSDRKDCSKFRISRSKRSATELISAQSKDGSEGTSSLGVFAASDPVFDMGISSDPDFAPTLTKSRRSELAAMSDLSDDSENGRSSLGALGFAETEDQSEPAAVQGSTFMKATLVQPKTRRTNDQFPVSTSVAKGNPAPSVDNPLVSTGGGVNSMQSGSPNLEIAQPDGKPSTNTGISSSKSGGLVADLLSGLKLLG